MLFFPFGGMIVRKFIFAILLFVFVFLFLQGRTNKYRYWYYFLLRNFHYVYKDKLFSI
jgi:hypothetical protein